MLSTLSCCFRSLYLALVKQCLFAPSGRVHSVGGKLGKLAAQRLLRVTMVVLVLAIAVTAARVGCQGQGELNSTLASSLPWFREYSLEKLV